jgi:hypothetical protein
LKSLAQPRFKETVDANAGGSGGVDLEDFDFDFNLEKGFLNTVSTLVKP